MSLLKETHKTIILVFGILLSYAVLAGPYYTMLDEFYDIAAAEGDPTMNVFISWTYPAFFYGFPGIFIFGLIWVILGLYRAIRRRYYASEEVTYYGS